MITTETVALAARSALGEDADITIHETDVAVWIEVSCNDDDNDPVRVTFAQLVQIGEALGTDKLNVCHAPGVRFSEHTFNEGMFWIEVLR